MRHQSWSLKIDYQNGTGTGNIIWRLGYQGDFALVSPTLADWFYMQHYPNILSESNGVITFAIFDNGDDRIVDSQGDICGTAGQIVCYSRAVVMDVDELNKTATVRYQHTLSQYSFWGGSVQLMPNENYVAGLSATTLGSRAEEFAGDSSQAPVWQMDVIGQNPDMYRSLRLPSLYPGVTWP
jgi:arylsulfate sulfotransferase